MKRGKPIRAKNPARARERHALAFLDGLFLAHVKSYPCPCCNGRSTEAHHVKSRGAGGTWRDAIGVCSTFHRELHNLGRFTAAKRHGLTHEGLLALARERNAIWEGNRRAESLKGTAKLFAKFRQVALDRDP